MSRSRRTVEGCSGICTHATTLIEHLGALFAGRFHIEVPSVDTDLLETGILDAFQFVELLFLLEQRFGLHISIDDIDLEDVRTLARIARLVAGNRANDPSAAQSAPPIAN